MMCVCVWVYMYACRMSATELSQVAQIAAQFDWIGIDLWLTQHVAF